MAGGYGSLAFLVYAPYSSALGSDHFRGGIDHARIAILFYDRAVASMGTESQVYGLRIGIESICADLQGWLVTTV